MKIRVPASSANLGPGFDALGLALGLYNETRIEPSSYFSISVKGEGSDKPRIKTNNTFVNIFYDVYKELMGKKDNFRFEFTNAIPFSRGLGSSSSVIVGAIAAAYHMAGYAVDKEQVLNRALTLESHPDNITPSVYGGFVSAIVENEKVIMMKKELPKDICAIVVIPNTAMSTERSRKLLPKSYKTADIVFNLSHAALLSAAFMSENWEMLKVAAQDRIHEQMRMGMLPALFDVKRVALENGALMSTLSGSGSSFLNLAYVKHSKRLFDALSSAFTEFKVLALEFDNNGFVITQS
ncbi:MAG: homoserine kinase [Campylobacteraceae bacterium]|nr:homoserine kinase [Campylobacteraceae bacterium]